MAFAQAPHARLIPLPGGGVAFRTPAGLLRLEEEAGLAARMWPLLDGRRSLEDLSRDTGAPAARVRSLLEALAGQGLVTPRAQPETAVSLLAAAGLGVESPARPLEDRTVLVLGAEALARPTAEATAAWGPTVACAEAPRDADLLIAVARAPGARVLRDANAFSLRTGTPVLFAEWQGLSALLGPTRSGDPTGACWQCAELRAWANAPDPDVHAAEREGDHEPLGSVPAAHVHVLAGLLAAEAARMLGTGRGSLEAAQLEVNLWNLRTSWAPVLPVPACPACWTPRPARPPRLGDGTLPGVAGDILRLERRLVHPRTGLLQRVGSIPSEPDEVPLPLVTAVLSARLARRLAGHPASVGQTPLIGTGAAMDASTARARALGEAVERYSLAQVAHLDLHHATWDDVAHEAVHPDGLAHTSEAERAHHPILQPFDGRERHAWTWATDLATGEPARVLANLALPGIPRPRHQYLTPCFPNGTACAPTSADAAFRALREALERDALMLSWTAQRPLPRVRNEHVPSAEYQAIEAFTRAHGRELHLFDLTSDLDVPTYTALLLDRTGRGPALAMGTGCAFDPAQAAQRAAEEAVHMRARYRHLHRAGPPPPEASGPARWWHASALRDAAWLLDDPPETLLRKPFHDEAAPPEVRLDVLVRHLAARGLQPLLVDATPPDVASLKLHVASVLVPGLVPKTGDGIPHHWATPRLRERLGARTPPRLPLPFP